jgi:hypothetical protein
VSSPDAAEWEGLAPDLDVLLDLDPAARAARLAAIAVEDAARAQALARWLAAIEGSSGLLEPPATRAPAGTGPWRARELVGRGGMGEVWRGERADGAFVREVAIKFLRADRPGVATSIARERAALARLRHPGIAQLLDGGVADDGRPWLVTEWVDGCTLEDWVRERSPDLRARMDLLRRVALAVAAAHDRLVVHRDLKPANVMVDQAGEPRLLDFGIARILGDDAEATLTRDGALTPAYAAPEQLAAGEVGPRTDVHALGVLLWWLACGRTPHADAATSLAAMVERVCRHDAEPPSRHALLAGVDADLDAIALTALAREPQRRYPSAHAFAADLAAWLAGATVSARMPTRRERLLRLCRQHPLAAGLAVALAAALATGVAGIAWQAREADAARALAERERDAALAEVERSEQLVDAFSRLFREAPDDERLTASQWLDRAASQVDGGLVADPASRARLIARLGAIEQDRGQHGRALPLFERALSGPEGALDPALRAATMCRLASAEHYSGRADAAVARFDAAIALAETLSGSARMALYDCLVSRAGMALAAGQGDAAARAAAQRAVQVVDELALEDPRWRRAGALYLVAALDDLDGDAAAAAAGYAEVMAIDRALGTTDTSDHAALLTALAGSLDRAGRPREADARYAEGIALYARVSGRHPNHASDLANRATLKVQLEDGQGALELADAALAMLAALGDINPNAAVNALLARGQALRLLGRHDEAAAALADAGARMDALGVDVARRQRVHVAEAQLALARGDVDAARATIDAVVGVLRPLGRRGALAEALGVVAQAALAGGEPEKAVVAAEEAVALLDAAAARASPTALARARLLLAQALADAGRPAAARAQVDLALPRLVAAYGDDDRRVRLAHELIARAPAAD